jgi:hypothetical protein
MQGMFFDQAWATEHAKDGGDAADFDSGPTEAGGTGGNNRMSSSSILGAVSI